MINTPQHIPAAIIRFSEIAVNRYFVHLKNNKFIDPYLKEFLFKFYHCKLLFKKYKLTRDDLLILDRHMCILCLNAKDTPEHLFTECSYGSSMRLVRDSLINVYKPINLSLTVENLVYANLNNGSTPNTVINFLITVSNYCIYKTKMKKFYNLNDRISINDSKFSFTHKIKNRVITDHGRETTSDFINTWDPGGFRRNFDYSNNAIVSWNFNHY